MCETNNKQLMSDQQDSVSPAEIQPDDHTVLLVDDQQDTRDIFEIYLEEYGYNPRTAADGSEALDKLDDSIDVVLLDRRMPDMSGTDVLSEIRSGPYAPRVAMVTAVAPGKEILELPVDDYLIKPVSGDTLVETVRELLVLTRYETLLTEYHRLARINERLLSNSRDRPSVLFLSTLESEREELEQRLDALEAQLSDELLAGSLERTSLLSA